MNSIRLIILTAFLLSRALFLQAQSNTASTTVDTSALRKNIFKDNSKIYNLVKDMVSGNRDVGALVKPFSDTSNTWGVNLTNKAIVVVKHAFKYELNEENFKGENTDRTEIIVLHKDKSYIDNTNNWSDYLLNTKDVLLVFIGGVNDLQNSTIEIIKKKSFFSTSLADLITLSQAVLSPSLAMDASSASTKLPVTFVLLNPEKLNSPCNINITYDEKKEPLKVDIHERNFFAFHVGVSGQQLNKNQVKLQNQQLTVALDSTQKKEWTSNLVVMLTFYPFGGRDIDRFEPVYKQNLKGKTAGYVLYKYTAERIGIFGGAKLSIDPIQNLYLGASYAFSKNFNFNFGWTWANTLTPSVTSVGNINSISDAIKYADRKYERQTFIGVSFSPGVITDILGLKKEKESTKK
ncbi:hypothetical protein [Spirosoma aerolatum]|uniref:hypothetical protein n=1 Tax=Spirosoma aerolatum TaxID=1211326 RepID=UPI0009AE9FD1|nr:hypothetical protein [Spirosoma aerolatum]